MDVDRTKIRWNGWGWAAHKDELGAQEAVWTWLAGELGMPALLATPARPLEDLSFPAPALYAEDRQALNAIVGADRVRDDAYERAFHALGRSYYDLLRLRAGELSLAPDAVVYPRGTEEVLAVLALAADHGIAVIPYGGGTSVVGGVTAARGVFHSAITLDLSAMDRVIEVDPVCTTATAEAGIYGPALEKALQAKGFTLGHHPQSFEFSTLGGWIAHRGAGQGSNRYGRAEDWLVGAKLATPRGLLVTGDFPASAAGPQLKDLIPGSEGVFGIITEATVRVRALPAASAYVGYMFRDFESGMTALRMAAQEGVAATMLRLSDMEETRFFRVYGAMAKRRSLARRFAEMYLEMRGFGEKACALIAGFEGKAVAHAAKQFGAIARRHGALPLGRGMGEQWRRTRFQAPYLRDPMLDRGLGVDTLETAANWSKIGTLYAATRAAIEAAILKSVPRNGAKGIVMCHVSHSYADGASLYFTAIFPRVLDGDIAQWKAIKQAASEAVVANGGTISHHHGVGEDHLPWIAQEKGALGIEVLRAIKQTLDPAGVLNPGKLLPR
ncbi:MAG: FAD-binding oxidoreductase [Alphaproteobacteria bacterium]|nr:FAD-binding oxidoreductase [Alphaproteobacteria bacterium]MDE2629721.1 FAD-binding oxidoreductase [Alphaproteobacteria bacterium]